MSDLAVPPGPGGRAGHVPTGMALVRAHVPASELVRYAIDLRSATHGTGTFTRTFARYEPAPD